MSARPKSVTVIAWMLIIGAAIPIASLFFSMSQAGNVAMEKMAEASNLPVNVQTALTVVGGLAILIAAFGMLKGMPWSRTLYVCTVLLSDSIYVLNTKLPIKMMVPMMIIQLILITFLFLPKANQYFARGKVTQDA